MQLRDRLTKLETALHRNSSPSPPADPQTLIAKIHRLCEATGEKQRPEESLADTFARTNGMTLQELRATFTRRL